MISSKLYTVIQQYLTDIVVTLFYFVTSTFFHFFQMFFLWTHVITIHVTLYENNSHTRQWCDALVLLFVESQDVVI